MTKSNNYKVPTARSLAENIESSPYYNVATIMLRRRGIDNPNIADLLEAFHEISKVAHKLDKEKK